MMDGTANRPGKRYICIGILAHVDAGKTTLSEGLLYAGGMIRSPGRVDNGDAYLDHDKMERQRGITIFSKQAVLAGEDTDLILLDTPGHVDFSPEMERTLQVLDYAVLVISGADGVQSHTRTLWRLLEKYNIPVFVFFNKMDLHGPDPQKLLWEMKQLNGNCVAFGAAVTGTKAFFEDAAMCDEDLLESYLATGSLTQRQIRDAVAERKIIPCYFGSALRMEGVEAFLDGMRTYMKAPSYGDTFSARVFKISRDDQGSRLTHMKITGGSLSVRDVLRGRKAAKEAWEEKVSQIRIYSGRKYEAVPQAYAGEICVVPGLHHTAAGDGLGAEEEQMLPTLVPVLTYRVCLPDGVDSRSFLPRLRLLEEEEPQLHVAWNEQSEEIQVQVMGQVQLEVLKHLIADRYEIPVTFDSGAIMYKETIAGAVEGVGHFEPLRHYAEVHVLLEPLEAGSGIVCDTRCSTDVLSRNWQRLVLTHLKEREHRGVLTGSPITDMKLTLVAGRTHQKHTEGGDFRQATYRAVRQGLMEADSVLLEPWYDFRLSLPVRNVGRAMTDIEKMGGTAVLDEAHDETKSAGGSLAVLTGMAPVSSMREYHLEVAAYTGGEGTLSVAFHGYLPCHNGEEVISAIGYDPDLDEEQPAGSVFCAHGAGYVVPWYEVKDHMHVESAAMDRKPEEAEALREAFRPERPEKWLAEEEVNKILDHTLGANKKNKIDKNSRWGGRFYGQKTAFMEKNPAGKKPRPQPVKEKYLLVDGYNIIFAWEELRKLAESTIDGARGKLMDILCNYQAFVRCQVILVFDAYRVQGHSTEVLEYHNIKVVYTKEAETADQYIEKFAHANSRQYHVIVATSDGLEQVIIRGEGCQLWSAGDLRNEIGRINEAIREGYLSEP